MLVQGSYLKYWGKAKPASAVGAQFHLLAYHSLDVAAVAQQYLVSCPRVTEAFQRILKVQFAERQIHELIIFLVALHDLGKFADAFQSQREDIWQKLLKRQTKRAYSIRHDTLGFECWRQIRSQVLASDLQDFQYALAPLMRAVCGHHGQPPKGNASVGRFPIQSHFEREDLNAATEFALAAARLIISPPTLSALKTCEVDFDTLEETTDELSWWLSGLAVLSDWLGSNTDWFPYKADIIPLGQYWQEANTKAEKAIAESGLLPATQAGFSSPTQVFDYLERPTPLQEYAMEQPLTDGPQLFVLEDVTGSGKTEAALLLAHRLMSEKAADGLYFALPTMATANAMYGRVADVYKQLFDNPNDASLVLAHGGRNLNSVYKDSIFQGSWQEQDKNQADETASARCSAWLSDNRKKALLAHVGVGTIDQALQAVLPNKHQSLRLFGLLGKVLVVDEVHSADSYMNELLQALLKFHAASGGSAILLTATLSKRHRQQLLSAFADGLDEKKPAIQETDYPLATQYSADRFQETKLETRASVARSISVVLEPDLEAVFQQIETQTDQGGCVGWIRNTVADAMAAYKRLKPIYGDDCQLFHARFTMGDRLAIEQDVLSRFGKAGNAKARRGKVLIGTQVLQESLDVDFDLLISDLAPIDSLIQRAGRLHRHTRINGECVAIGPDDRPKPTMLLYGPLPNENCKSDWYEQYFPKACYVYPDHGQLWLAADVLNKQQAIVTPSGCRNLIESVYGEDAEQNIPSTLQRRHQEADGELKAKASTGRLNTLKLNDGYQCSGMIDWWSDAKTPTRLGTDTQTLTLFKLEGDQLVPWYGRNTQLAESQINVYLSKITTVVRPSEISETQWEALKQRLPDKGKWSEIAVLTECDGHSDCFQAVNGDGQKALYSYNATLGLEELAK